MESKKYIQKASSYKTSNYCQPNGSVKYSEDVENDIKQAQRKETYKNNQNEPKNSQEFQQDEKFKPFQNFKGNSQIKYKAPNNQKQYNNEVKEEEIDGNSQFAQGNKKKQTKYNVGQPKMNNQNKNPFHEKESQVHDMTENPFDLYNQIHQSILKECQQGLLNINSNKFYQEQIFNQKEIPENHSLQTEDGVNQKINCDSDKQKLLILNDSIFSTDSHLKYQKILVNNILANFKPEKRDLIEYINQMLTDFLNINENIFQTKIDHITLLLTQFQEENVQKNNSNQYKDTIPIPSVHFDFLKFDSMDSHLSQLISDQLDFLIRFRRSFLKDLNQSQIQTICTTLLEILNDQEKRVNQLAQISNQDILSQMNAPPNLIAFRSMHDEILRECCLRMIGQVCFENSLHIDDSIIQKIYEYVNRIAFLPESVYQIQKNQQSMSNQKNVNSMFYKSLRAAFNCIANILSQEDSQFIMKNNQKIFQKLKNEFEYMINKMQTYYKSKRFISQMTTLLRALQFSMNLGTYSPTNLHPIKQGPGSGQNIIGQQPSQGTENINSTKNIDLIKKSELKIPDNEAVGLFISFYKLLFLGTTFAKKILKLKFENDDSKQNSQKGVIFDINNLNGQTTDEEHTNNSDIGGNIFDTSDQVSSDNCSASKDINEESDAEIDPYQKIKIHANLALRNILKNNNQILINYWCILLPSFMIRPQSEFKQYLYTFEDQQMRSEFEQKVFQFMETQEPSLFYVIRQLKTQSQLKSSVYATIQVMLDHSQIQFHQHELEKEDQNQITQHKSYFQMSDFISQFLRFNHYILIFSLNEVSSISHLYPTNPKKPQRSNQNEPIDFFDRQTFIQIVKVIQTLIRVTPYHLMRKGLSSIIVKALIENIQLLDRVNNRDQLIRNEICSAINQALAKNEISQELKTLFTCKSKIDLKETLLGTMLKVQNFISNEKIQILQTLGKNYPEVLTNEWLLVAKNSSIPRVQHFLQESIQKIERKKVSQILKIIEEWIKNYHYFDKTDNNDEKVLKEEQKEQKVENQISPYNNPFFCKFMMQLIDQNLFQQEIVYDNGHQHPKTEQWVTQVALALEVNTCIAVLNLICIMNQEQYQKVFTQKKYTNQLLQFLTDVIQINQKHKNVVVPSILKSAIIKTYGYLIQHIKSTNQFKDSTYVCNTILGHCLSPQIQGDTNINVQIRNSWTISFICSLYPIHDIILSKQSENLELTDSSKQIQSNFDKLIELCFKYVCHTTSNKEKVAASSIRALGFIAQNLISLDNQQQTGQLSIIMPPNIIRTHIEKIVNTIIQRLYNQSQSTAKVVWNLCVAISKIIDTYNKINKVAQDENYMLTNYRESYLAEIFCFETTKCFLSIFMEGQNYKTKIHACQTLMKYANLSQYGYLDEQKNPENLLKMFWMHIQEQIKYQINYDQVKQNNIVGAAALESAAYIEQINRAFIDFWAHICNLTQKSLSSPFEGKQTDKAIQKDTHQNIMIEYFNNNAFDLLQSIIKYLQRELKIPEYLLILDENDEFTQKDFQKETEQLFDQNPHLFEKLSILQKSIIRKIFEIIDQEGSQVTVSLLVYTSFSKLSCCDVKKDYRGLEMLRISKSSFDPTHN